MQDASAYGISESTTSTFVRRTLWRRLASGVVLTRPDAPTRSDWAVVGLALGGPGAALSGWDALGTYGIAAKQCPAAPVLVLTTTGKNRTVGGLHLRPTSRPYGRSMTSVVAPDLPLVVRTPVARAVADAALQDSRTEIVRATVMRAVQRGLCSVADLEFELDAMPRNGSAGFRRAIADLVTGARSVAEIRAIRGLRRAPVPPFEVNVELRDPSGRVVAVADVLWRALRAVLEIDSREFHFTERDWKATMARHNRLTTLGLSVTHYPPSAITAGNAWLVEVESWLRQRACLLGVPYVPARAA